MKNRLIGKIPDQSNNVTQPRDKLGRFASYKTVIILDEFGNAGKVPQKHETKFGYAISVTEKPDAFGKICRIKENGKEIKARDDKNKDRVTREIRQIGTRTYGYYVDKSNPPKGWNNPDRSKVMLSILDYTLDQTLSKTDGNTYIIIDHHKSYKDHIHPMIRDKSRPERIIDGNDYDSKNSEFAPQLQTHDYVANAVRSDVELKHSERVKILGTKIQKINRIIIK